MIVITTPSSANKRSVTDVIVGDSIIRPTAVARNIAMMFVLSLTYQVSKLCQVAFLYIRRIRSTRDCLTQHATELLIHSLVTYRLDYGNGLLYGVSGQLLDKLQMVQNDAARVVVKASRYDHMTPILKTLHCLRPTTGHNGCLMMMMIFYIFTFFTGFVGACNNAFEQGHLEPWRYINAFIIVIIIIIIIIIIT